MAALGESSASVIVMELVKAAPFGVMVGAGRKAPKTANAYWAPT